MWALDALGLDAEADERAVKRAYARLLKGKRPDDDPQAFQTLHERYEAALAFVRSNVTVPEGQEVAEADGREAEDARSAGDSAVDLADSQSNVIESSSDAGASFEEPAATQEDDAPEVFDLDAFLEDLLSNAEHCQPSAFQRWIEDALSNWPFGFKAFVADHILDGLVSTERSIRLSNLQAILEAFALDDVLNTIDPAQLILLHQRMARAEQREHRGTFTALFDRKDRRQLIERMREKARGDYRPTTTRIIAFLLTSGFPRVFAAVLRYVPFLRVWIVRFLDRVDEGRLDALTPGINEKVLKRWAETKSSLGTTALLRNTFWFIFISLYFVLPAVVYATSTACDLFFSEFPPPALTIVASFFNEIEAQRLLSSGRRSATQGDHIEAQRYFEDIIDRYKAPWTPDLEIIVSNAYLERASVFEKEGSRAQARAAYEDLFDAFSGSSVDATQATVAAGLLKKASLYFVDDDFQSSYDTYNRVIDRYGDARNDYTDQSVADAMYGAMTCLKQTHQFADATQIGERMLSAFSSTTDPMLYKTVQEVRDLMGEMR